MKYCAVIFQCGFLKDEKCAECMVDESFYQNSEQMMIFLKSAILRVFENC